MDDELLAGSDCPPSPGQSQPHPYRDSESMQEDRFEILRRALREERRPKFTRDVRQSRGVDGSSIPLRSNDSPQPTPIRQRVFAHNTVTMFHIESLFKNQPGQSYDSIYNTFIRSLPSSTSASEKDVRAWLKSWFTVSDIFDSDYALDQYMNRIELSGLMVHKMRKSDLVRYWVNATGQFTPSKMSHVEWDILTSHRQSGLGLIRD
jgi:hypothetical protein